MSAQSIIIVKKLYENVRNSKTIGRMRGMKICAIKEGAEFSVFGLTGTLL